MRFSAHLSMLFRELPLPERPAAARAAGFDTVESWWPPELEADALAAAIGAEGLGVACLNCFAGDLERGERGFLNQADRHARTLADFAAAVAYGRRLGTRSINVLVGRELRGVPVARQRAVAVATLRDIAGEAAAAGVTVLIEPLNPTDVPGSLVPTPAAAVELIEAVGSDAVALLYDAYHAAAAGCRPEHQVREFAPLIGHVQVADFPGRGAPGTGTIDFPTLFEELEEVGYRGAVGLEFAPAGATPDLAEIVAPYDRAVGGRR
jgi:hydroxypyruvate isomerase